MNEELYELMLEGGQLISPVNRKEVVSRVSKGTLSRDVKIRKVGTEKWVRLKDIPRFEKFFSEKLEARASVQNSKSNVKSIDDSDLQARRVEFESLLAACRGALSDAMDLAREKTGEFCKQRRSSQLKFLLMLATGVGAALALRKRATIIDPLKPEMLGHGSGSSSSGRVDASRELDRVWKSNQYKSGATSGESAFNAMGQAISNVSASSANSSGDRVAAEMRYQDEKKMADAARSRAGVAAGALGAASAVSGALAFKEMISEEGDNLAVLDIYKDVVLLLDIMFEAAHRLGAEVIRPFEPELQNYASLYGEVLSDMARLHRGLLGYDFDGVLGHPQLCPSRLLVKSSIVPEDGSTKERGAIVKSLCRFAYLPEQAPNGLVGVREKGIRRALARIMLNLGIGRRVNRSSVFSGIRDGLGQLWQAPGFAGIKESKYSRIPDGKVVILILVIAALTPASIVAWLSLVASHGEDSVTSKISLGVSLLLVVSSIFVLPTVLALISGRREVASILGLLTVASVILFPVAFWGGAILVLGVLPLALMTVLRASRWSSAKKFGTRSAAELESRLEVVASADMNRRFRVWIDSFDAGGWVPGASQFDLRGRHQDWRDLGFYLDIDADQEGASERLGIEEDPERDGVAGFRRGMYAKTTREVGDLATGTKVRVEGVTKDDFLIVASSSGSRRHVFVPTLLRM